MHVIKLVLNVIDEVSKMDLMPFEYILLGLQKLQIFHTPLNRWHAW